MRRININNPEELKRFKLETSGFVSSYGFPYRLDDLTDKGANYTVFCPLKWKSAFSPAKLHKLLKEDVDADRIRVEYIDFVKEPLEDNNAILSFIDTIKVKEVDLEKSISDWLSEGLPNDEEEIDYIKETAKHFFELGMAVSNKAQKGEEV